MARPGMHPEDIKAAMRKAGTPPSALSARLGLNPSTVGLVIRRECSARVQAEIADIIGIPPQAIWPSRYLPDGSPRRRGRQVGQARATAHRQIEAAE